MSELRSRIIRLAHERSDLRPHLLPLIAVRKVDATGKVAWTPLPSDGFAFGYEGEDSDAAGRKLALKVRAAVRQTQEQADQFWKDLAYDLIMNSEYDVQPDLSRVVVSTALRMTYRTLAETVEAYFDAVPTR